METPDLKDRLTPETLSPYQQVAQWIGGGQYAQALGYLGKLDKKTLLSSHALLNAYGVALRGTGKAEAAIEMYHLALKLDDMQGGTWSNLGNALKDANYPKASICAHRQALDLAKAPDSKLWHNYGIALAMAGQHHDAIAAFETAIEVAPEKNGLRWDLARSQLALKDYRQGFINYQYRWDMEEAPPKRVFGAEWTGMELPNQALYVYVEQGFGDYIQCARYLPLFQKRAPHLTVEVKPELRVLMEQSFPDIRFVDYQESKREITEGFIASILDAPRYFPDAPISGQAYLAPRVKDFSFDARLTQKLAQAKILKVGIIWSGSITFKRNQFRAAPVNWFYNHFVLPGVSLFSLQMGPRADDLNALPLPLISTELMPHIQNFNDTANIVKNLDLVIMTCSSTAHLCGALHVPCWVLLDSSPHWLWGQDRPDSDWYSSIRLFRQKSPGDWRSVFDQVAAELMALGIQADHD
jgi:hypothetical protein